jgi:hypothetical protein
MIPTVSQQIFAIRNSMAKTVIPALSPNEKFAAEQANLIVASLDWLLDAHESEHRYEMVELGDYRTLVAELAELRAGEGASDARAALDDTAATPADLGALRTQTRRLKVVAEKLFRSLVGEDDTAASAAHQLYTAAARRQSERELAWCRMTGFPENGTRSVTEVLEAQG